ncbi:unnamed protein product [Amoebophrya sp. A25]|nr:unnamed protein product [Amoebophrya sp. A25]|eukprot:GSA25T00001536001.1
MDQIILRKSKKSSEGQCISEVIPLSTIKQCNLPLSSKQIMTTAIAPMTQYHRQMRSEGLCQARHFIVVSIQSFFSSRPTTSLSYHDYLTFSCLTDIKQYRIEFRITTNQIQMTYRK